MDLEQVRNVLHFVLSGGIFVPPAILMQNVPRERSPDELTERETLILGQLRNGKQNKVIAYELGLSEATVKVHIRHILTKLNVRNRTEAVSASIKNRVGI
jgi:DNA-binding NarL/FixJ family response regulator